MGPRAAIHEYNKIATKALQHLLDEKQRIEVRSTGRDFDVNDLKHLHIEYYPDIDLGLFDVQLRFSDSDRRVVTGIRIEQVRQFVIPLAHGLIRPSDHTLDAPIRQAGVIQECCFNALLCRRIWHCSDKTEK